MTHIVSITNQGQISIPAIIRKSLGLDTYKKASVRQEEGRVIIEPIEDIFTLAGALKKYSVKGSAEMTWRDAAVSRYKKSLKP